MLQRSPPLLLAALVSVFCSAASAQGAAPLTPEDVARPPDYASPVISRSGRYLAVRVPVDGRMNVAVIDLEERVRITLTSHNDVDVVGVSWLGNDRIIYRTTSRVGDANAYRTTSRVDDVNPIEAAEALHVVSRDGSARNTFFQSQKEAGPDGVVRSLRLFRRLPGDEKEAIFSGNLRDPHSLDLWRVNVETGQRSLLTSDRPEGTYRFLADADRVARVALATVRGTTTRTIHYRDSERAPWREVARFDLTQPGAIVPLRIAADGRRLIVASNQGRDNMAVFVFDPETRKLVRRLFEHPSLDAESDALGNSENAMSVGIDGATEEVTGTLVNLERPQVTWTLEDDRRQQRSIDRLLPDTHNTITRLRGDSYLVTASASDWPTSWHLLNEAKGTLEDVLTSRAWLLPDKLQPLRLFELKSRDGLSIPSYFLLPRNRAGGARVPTVVLLNRAPSFRYLSGEISSELLLAQLLVSRGYAVVLPNVRGSGGFGNRVLFAGFGAMGRQVIDDVDDAAQWAVREGIADPARICVAGTFYGAYSALIALARYPERFACAVASEPIADVKRFLTEGRDAAHQGRTALWLARAGAREVTGVDADRSPLALAEKIKKPVLLQWSDDGFGVPREQVQSMADALRAAGNAPSLLMFSSGEKTSPVALRTERFRATLQFLDRNLAAAAAR